MSKMICAVCGSVSNPKTVTKGSIFIELVLWLCFIIPGVIYSIWRLTTRHEACRECGSKNIVPIDSPVGRKLVADFHPHEDFTSTAEYVGQEIGKLFSLKK